MSVLAPLPVTVGRRPCRSRLPRGRRETRPVEAGSGRSPPCGRRRLGSRLSRLLPAERRDLAVDALEERFERLDSLRLAAVRRLLRLPAADLPALALKLDLAVAERAWEMSGAEDCLTVIAADARRISEKANLWDPEDGH